jgi:hypothetical protein
MKTNMSDFECNRMLKYNTLEPNCIYPVGFEVYSAVTMKNAIFFIYLGESEQKPSDGGDHNAAHQKEGDVLRPECYINIDSNPVDCYFHTSCNWIFLSHTIKNNVDG